MRGIKTEMRKTIFRMLDRENVVLNFDKNCITIAQVDISQRWLLHG